MESANRDRYMQRQNTLRGGEKYTSEVYVWSEQERELRARKKKKKVTETRGKRARPSGREESEREHREMLYERHQQKASR